MSDGAFIPVKQRGRVRDYAWVDEQDVERVSKYGWVLVGGYAIATRCLSDAPLPSSPSMHRFILGLGLGEGVGHHINEDTLDNRRHNLAVYPDLTSHGVAPHPRRDARVRGHDLPPHDREVRLAERKAA